MLHTVKKVQYLDGYRLKLLFNDRKVKIVDLSSMMKKAKNMFLPLVDIDYFKQVKCDGITICWPNGVDLCPDTLYKMGKDIASSPKKRKITARSTKIRKKQRLKTV